jgi:hypothetical protein
MSVSIILRLFILAVFELLNISVPEFKEQISFENRLVMSLIDIDLKIFGF